MAIAIVKPQLVTLNCFPFDLDAQRSVEKSGLWTGLVVVKRSGNLLKKMILFFGVQCNISSCACNNAQRKSDVLFALLVTCNTTYACKTTRPFIVGREISDCFTPHRTQPHFNSTPAAN